MLFHLLIVDDEPTIRKGLSSFIKWDTLDCIVDNTACDGLEAMDKIRLLPPDIVITDIKMPQADGIELSKFIHNHYPSIKVIILTGYADFEYAQSAIKYQVTDFILKPTSKDKLIESVKKAQTLILTDVQNKSIKKEDLSFLREQLFQELVTTNTIDGMMQNRIAQYGVTLDNYIICAFQFSDCEQEDLNDSITALKNMMTAQSEAYDCFRYNNFLLVLFPLKLQVSGVTPAILKYCEEIIEILYSLHSITLSAGISLAHIGCAELADAAMEAIQALSMNFYQEKSISVYDPSLEERLCRTNVEYTMILYHLETNLQDRDFSTAATLLNTLFSQLKVQLMNAMDVRNLCIQIYYIYSRCLIKKNLTPLSSSILMNIHNCMSIYQLETLMKGLLEDIHTQMFDSKNQLSPIIEKAIAYINLHFPDNLSLEIIADYVHVNPSHLSRTFKKECRESITEYISKARIEKAQELLSLSNTLAYEVAEKVGFHDPAYFSVTFKKYTGLSPKEFKSLS